MKVKILIILYALFFNLSVSKIILAEDSLALQEQDDSGRPMSGVGWLCGLNTRTSIVCVNDFRYTLTKKTKFQSEDGSQSSSESFQMETLVQFKANEKGELITLALFNDLEGEYSPKKPDFDTKKSNQGQGEQPKAKKEKLVKEKGVWKN